MPKKQTSYGRPLIDNSADAVIVEIEKYQGRVPYELTPLALTNLHSYINRLEDGQAILRNRLSQVSGLKGDINADPEEQNPGTIRL